MQSDTLCQAGGLISHGFHRVHAGCYEAGNQAGTESDHGRKDDPEDDASGAYNHLEIDIHRVDGKLDQEGGSVVEEEADQTTQETKENGFDKELEKDERAPRAECFLQPDLKGSFLDRSEHDIANPESTNDHGKEADEEATIP